jgi:hypothetical protein
VILVINEKISRSASDRMGWKVLRFLIMKIIANINGWKKEIEAPPSAFYKGYFFIVIFPPLEVVVRKSDMVTQGNTTKVMLRRTSEREFSYIP